MQAFYSVRSERQLMEQIEYDLLFRWFVGLGVDDPVWDRDGFTQEPRPAAEGDVAQFLAAVLAHPEVKRLLSSEHFSVDGTLIKAWASMKSFQPKDGERTSRPRAGPQRRARLPGREAVERDARQHDRPGRAALPQGPRPGGEALLIGHALMENRNGLIVDASDAGHRHAERGGARHDRGRRAGRPADHARRRQGLRHRRLRHGVPRGRT